MGDLATKFAVSMGYEEETLETSFSDSKWKNWKENQTCQPNFWTVNSTMISLKLSYHFLRKKDQFDGANQYYLM